MKYIIAALILFVTVAGTCGKTTKNAAANQTVDRKCYKARLEIKGLCMNYTIKVLEGDTAALNLPAWTDETDNKTHTNVFALANPCSFPDMKEGDEFYFTLLDKDDARCNVCMAYRPVPPVRLNIAVSQTPCR